MKHSICFVLVLVFASCRHEMMPIQAQSSVSDQTKAFLQWFGREDCNQVPFNLLDSVSTDFMSAAFPLPDCLNDSINLTVRERDQIAKQFKHPPLISVWSGDLVPNAHIIPLVDIDKTFKNDIDDGWKAFYRQYGDSFWSFGLPIFLRENTLCLFFSCMVCGGHCGYGGLTLYKKDGKGWKKVRDYGAWMS